MLNHNIQCLSQNRLSPYLKLCQNDLENAVCIYTSLQHRSAIYFTLIQEIEITFRNELSNTLTNWLKTSKQSPTTDLYDFFKNHMRTHLNQEGQKQLQKALSDVKKNYTKKQTGNKNPDHNDIISHLTFGFWVYLLDQNSQHTTYWNSIFKNIFDNRFSTLCNLFTRMQDVLRFRNNLYHQEAVWKGKNINTPHKALQNLEKKFRNFQQYLAKLSPQRSAVVDESYQLNETKIQLFDQNTFINEIASLRNMLINPGLTQ